MKTNHNPPIYDQNKTDNAKINLKKETKTGQLGKRDNTGPYFFIFFYFRLCFITSIYRFSMSQRSGADPAMTSPYSTMERGSEPADLDIHRAQ